jgi:hypothetical protein
MTACVLFNGCGGQSYKGSDEDVKKLVLQIVRDEFRNKFAMEIYSGVTGIPLEIHGIKVTYELLKQNAHKDAAARKALAKIDEVMSKTKMVLQNIRTNKIDKAIKKSFNSADLVITFHNGKTYTSPIKYTAQFTDDGNLYVQVFNLR